MICPNTRMSLETFRGNGGAECRVRACACSPGLSRHGAKLGASLWFKIRNPGLPQYYRDYHSPRGWPLICCGGPGLLAWGNNVCLAGRCVEELLSQERGCGT